jgi:protoheme IX farnesyltransferase
MALPTNMGELPSDAAVETAPALVGRAAALSLRGRLADFAELAKPRLNTLVVITTAVGYYMAVEYTFQWALMVYALVGTALTAAGASALNQYLERHWDARMQRTANRPLAAGRMAPRDALIFAVALSVLGVGQLALLVNVLTAALGAITLLAYVFIYTPMKRLTPSCTLVGAVPGAIPPVMGWTAVRGELSPEAMVLFIILFLWQMPHFLAIATLYRDDYRRGGFKMLPVVEPDLRSTGRQMVLYAAALLPASLMPMALGMVGPLYAGLALILGLAFLGFALACSASGARNDARRLFLASILYLPLLLAFMMIDKV